MERRDFLRLAAAAATATGMRSVPSRAADAAFWVEGIEPGLARAHALGRPAFVYFDAPWCSWCQLYERETLSRPAVRDYLARHYVPVLVDYDLRPDVFQRYGGRGLPFTVLLAPDGTVITRFTGVLRTGDLLDMLADLRTRTTSAVTEFAPPQEAVRASRIDAEGLKRFRAAFLEHLESLYDPARGTLAGRYASGATLKRPSPLTWLYLHARGLWKERVQRAATLERERLWDPVNGGFFNFLDPSRLTDEYTETSKLLESNAWLTALFAATGREAGADRRAALSGWFYLREVLWDRARGGFWQAQRADAAYYGRSPAARLRVAMPPVERVKRADTNAQAALALLRFADATGLAEARAYARETVDYVLRDLWYDGRLYHAWREGRRETPDLPMDWFWVLLAGGAVEKREHDGGRAIALGRIAGLAERWLEARPLGPGDTLTVEAASLVAWTGTCANAYPRLATRVWPQVLDQLRIEPETPPDEIVLGLAAWEAHAGDAAPFPVRVC